MKTPKIRQLNPQSAQPVEVFCRVKPKDDDNKTAPCIAVVNDQTVQSNSGENSRSVSHKEILHTFTRVFDPAGDQPTIFNEVALPLVTGVVQGKNGLLFTYGVTGSGKTYTMQGDPKNPGILPRTLDVIFNTLGDLQTKKYVVKSDGMNGFDVQSEADAMMERQRLEILGRQQTPRRERLEGINDFTHETSVVEGVDDSVAYAVFVSLIEVYNNYVFDLLQEIPETPNLAARTPQNRALREDPRRNVYVAGSTEVEVKSAEDALRIFLTGQKRRRVGHTILNAESSRSHSVFTVRIVRVPWDASIDEANQSSPPTIDSTIKAAVGQLSAPSDTEMDSERPERQLTMDKRLLSTSQLCLVDLAGSERTNRTGNKGDRLKEASNINTSLMGLRKCIEVLRENQRSSLGSAPSLVPYRDNKLTHLFRTFFDGDGRVRMLVCINQLPEEYDETINVLKFAESTQEVQTFKTPLPSTPRARFTPSGHHNHSITSSAARRGPPPPIWAMEISPSFPELETDLPFLESITWTQLLSSDPQLSNRLDVTLRQGLSRITDAISIVEREQSNFRSQLVSLDDRSGQLEGQNRQLMDSGDNHRAQLSTLEAKNRRLESELAEKTAQLRHEKAERSRAPRTPRTTSNTPSTTVVPTITETPRGATPHHTGGGCVSTLSRQWEGRFKQQQQIAEQQRVSTLKRKPGLPAMNPRHRRSKSAGQLWLDHQDVQIVPTGTVMTPVLKKKKSVTKLEMKDTTKATNYILTHQETDDLGNLETRLYKGEIIPTAGGGSSVIFSDVEALRQSSPVDRKRRSSRLLENQPPDQQEPLHQREIEDRCRIAITSQPQSKKPRALR